MNAEELKLITETIQALGQNGQTAFIWWLVFDKLLPAIVWLVTLIALLKFALAPLLTINASYEAIRKFRDRLGTGTSGYLSNDEFHRTTAAIDKLISGAKNEQ